MQAPSSSAATVMASLALLPTNAPQDSTSSGFSPCAPRVSSRISRRPGVLRHEEAAAGMRGEEVLQKTDRPGRPSVHRQRRRGLRRERDGGAAPVPAAALQARLGMGRQRREELLDGDEELGPERAPGVRGLGAGSRTASRVSAQNALRRVVDVLGEDHDGAGREIVRQGRGLLEEQGQVVLDARRPPPLADLAIHRASRGVALETPPPCPPEPRHRIWRGLETREPGAGRCARPGFAERWLSGSKARRLSISSSNRSMRSGASAPIGKRSSSEPRTAYSPCSITWLTQAYPARSRRRRNVSTSRRVRRAGSGTGGRRRSRGAQSAPSRW